MNNINGQEILYYNQDFKMKQKNKNIKKNNNISSKNENNPVKIKKIYNIKNNKIDYKISGYLTSKKK